MAKRGRPKKKIEVQSKMPVEIKYSPSDETSNPILLSVKKKIESLKFIRIFDLKLIPKYLLEQVKPHNFDLNELYAQASQFENDPFTLFYALADEGHKIKGFVWFYLNTIFKSIDCQVLTIDKEYQDRGEIVRRVINFMNPIKEKLKFKGRIITTRPKAFARLGFHQTGEVYMEV